MKRTILASFRTKPVDPNDPSVGSDLLKVFFGSAAILAVLLGTGLAIYGDLIPSVLLLLPGVGVLTWLFKGSPTERA